MGDTGHVLEAVEQRTIENIGRRLRGVLLAWQAVAGGDEMIGAIAEISVAHLLEAAQQQAGGGDKNNRDCNLRDDQAGAETRVAAAGGAGASSFFKSVVHAGADGSESGQQAAEDAGEDSECEREGDDAPVETDIGNEW